MRHLLISIVSLAIAASACGKKDKDKSSGDKAAQPTEAAQPAAEPPKPYEGPLTAERLQQAKDATKPFQKWDEAYARLLGTVGKPTEVDGKDHLWYLLVGDQCHELSVENANGEVGAVGLGQYSDVMKEKFAKCQPAAAEGETGEGEGEGDDGEGDDGEGDDGDEGEGDDGETEEG